MSVNVVQYHKDARAALKELDPEAARRLLIAATDAGEHIDAFLAWMVLEGPFKVGGDSVGSTEWDIAANAFVQSNPLFSSRETLDVLVKCLKSKGDVVEWDGTLDVYERVPAPIKKSLNTPSADMEPTSKKPNEEKRKSFLPYVLVASGGVALGWLASKASSRT